MYKHKYEQIVHVSPLSYKVINNAPHSVATSPNFYETIALRATETQLIYFVC